MKKLYTVFVVLSVLLFTTNIFAQAASVTWALNSTTHLTSVSLGNVTGSAESISSGSGQFGMSVFDYSIDGQRLWEGTAGWIAGTEETTRYIQFDALPSSGNSFSVTNVSFNYGAAGIDNNIQSNAYYSTDGWVTRTLLNPSHLTYSGSGMSLFTQDVSITVASGTTFSIRIYPYAIVNSSPMRPTFTVHNNVVITGTTAVKKNCLIQVTDVAGKWGKSILLTARLQETGAAGNTNLPNQVLKFYQDSVYVNSGTTNASGVASIAYTIPQDSATQSISAPQDSVAHSIRVEFGGDANYNAQNGTGTLTIVRHVTSVIVTPTAAVFGQPVVLVATLTDNDNTGSGIDNKLIRFEGVVELTGDLISIGSARTNTRGVASIIVVMEAWPSIVATFAGDVNYSPKSGKGTLKKMTAIQITDAAGKWGKSVLLTAILQEIGLAGNTNLPNQIIKFYQDSVYVNSGTTNTSGVASVMYTIPQDSATSSISEPQDSVTHSIRAEFAGDARYSALSSNGKLTVRRHTTSISVAPKSGSSGQTITLEASLTDNDESGKGVSNQLLRFEGVVELTGDLVSIGSATTNESGVANISYTLPQDSVTRTISVSFIGDVNYSPQSSTGKLTYTLVGVEKNLIDIPTKFDLLQNFPNPFNPTSTIRYDIPETGFVNISVYDILGREIKVLVNGEKNPGHYEIIFDARELASGIYFYTIRTAGFTQSKKMILMK